MTQSDLASWSQLKGQFMLARSMIILFLVVTQYILLQDSNRTMMPNKCTEQCYHVKYHGEGKGKRMHSALYNALNHVGSCTGSAPEYVISTQEKMNGSPYQKASKDIQHISNEFLYSVTIMRVIRNAYEYFFLWP